MRASWPLPLALGLSFILRRGVESVGPVGSSAGSGFESVGHDGSAVESGVGAGGLVGSVGRVGSAVGRQPAAAFETQCAPTCAPTCGCCAPTCAPICCCAPYGWTVRVRSLKPYGLGRHTNPGTSLNDGYFFI